MWVWERKQKTLPKVNKTWTVIGRTFRSGQSDFPSASWMSLEHCNTSFLAWGATQRHSPTVSCDACKLLPKPVWSRRSALVLLWLILFFNEKCCPGLSRPLPLQHPCSGCHYLHFCIHSLLLSQLNPGNRRRPIWSYHTPTGWTPTIFIKAFWDGSARTLSKPAGSEGLLSFTKKGEEFLSL